MKKVLVFVMTLAVLLIGYVDVGAQSAVDDFQDVTFERSGNRLLSEFTEKQYKKYRKGLKRKFCGWSINEVTKNEKISFIRETIYVENNQGQSSSNYEISGKREIDNKVIIKGSKGITTKLAGNKKIYKGGLEHALKIAWELDNKIESKLDFKAKFVVDGATTFTIKVIGKGKLTNGVACKYFFWIPIRYGGFEYLNQTCIFFNVSKIKYKRR